VKVTAIIPAAGSGKRMNGKKQFMAINGQPVLSATVSVFDNCQSIDDIIVVAAKGDIELTKNLLKDNKKVRSVVEGGLDRQDSVYNGLKEVIKDSDDDIILIHDAARPLVTKEIITKAIIEVKVSKAAIVGVPAKDTVKTVSSENIVLETLDRGSIWQVQTPQAFLASIIKEAYERAYRIQYRATDDSKLVERLGIPVKMVMGSYENIKITTIEDVAIAEAVLKGREKILT
jgi:2-C-methyl-D-erythritol 4-phosphate cytidylyltransferase